MHIEVRFVIFGNFDLKISCSDDSTDGFIGCMDMVVARLPNCLCSGILEPIAIVARTSLLKFPDLLESMTMSREDVDEDC